MICINEFHKFINFSAIYILNDIKKIFYIYYTKIFINILSAAKYFLVITQRTHHMYCNIKEILNQKFPKVRNREIQGARYPEGILYISISLIELLLRTRRTRAKLNVGYI